MKKRLVGLVGVLCAAHVWAADSAPTGFWAIAQVDIRGTPAADQHDVQEAEAAMRKTLGSAPGTVSTNVGPCLYLQPRTEDLVFFITVLRDPTGLVARLETLRLNGCQLVSYQVLQADTFADLLRKTGTAVAGFSTDNLPPAPDPTKPDATGVSFRPGYEEQQIPDDMKRKIRGFIDGVVSGLLAERVPIADRTHLRGMLQIKNPWVTSAGPVRRGSILNTGVMVMIGAEAEPPGIRLRAIHSRTGDDSLKGKVIPLNSQTGVKDAISAIREALEQVPADKAPRKP